MTGLHIATRAMAFKDYKYWYGGKGQIATYDLANSLKKQNPSVWTDSYYKKATAMIDKKTRVADCSHLVCASIGISDIGSYQIAERYVEVASPEDYCIGMIAWRPGHVGIIIYNDLRIAEMRSIDYGYQQTRTIKTAGMQKVFAVPGINYYQSYNEGWNREHKEGKWYFIDNGKLAIERWIVINKHWFYFDADGYMAEGEIEVSGQRYYIDSEVGCMKTDDKGALVEWVVE